MVEKHPMTVEGSRALKEELDHLKKVERFNIVKEIEVARAHGDLRENAEYHAAKEKQGMVEARISHVDIMLSNSEVIDTSQFSGDRVLFGASVTIFDLDTEEENTYRIVGEEQADIKDNTISYKSPIAQALIGREIGDEVIINTPKGKRKVEIMDVEFQ